MHCDIRRVILSLWILLLTWCLTDTARPKPKVYTMKMYKMWCDFPPKYFSNSSCGVKPHRDQKGRFYMKAFIHNELKTLNVSVKLYQKTHEYRPFLLQYQVDVCKMMNGKGFNLLHRLSYLVMSKISNCNHTCPFKDWFIVNEAVVEPKWIPSRLPDGLYRFDTNASNVEGYVGALKFYVIVTNPDF